MKPFLEKLPPSPGASVVLLNRRLEDAIPFQWHHHPELELTLTLNSTGQRFIGDHIGTYGDGDLVLIGPNLPHTWSSVGKLSQDAPHIALVSWVHPDWVATISKAMPELHSVSGLFARASRGLVFSQEVARKARPLIERQFEVDPDARLLIFLEVLTTLAADTQARALSTQAITPPAARGDRGRMDRLLDHIHLHYADALTIDALADLAALSPSGLHRLFRRHLNMAVTDYIMHLRIGQACALLSSTEAPVSHVAERVGYLSLANFNRQFKALKQITPRQYRQKFSARTH